MVHETTVPLERDLNLMIQILKEVKNLKPRQFVDHTSIIGVHDDKVAHQIYLIEDSRLAVGDVAFSASDRQVPYQARLDRLTSLGHTFISLVDTEDFMVNFNKDFTDKDKGWSTPIRIAYAEKLGLAYVSSL